MSPGRELGRVEVVGPRREAGAEQRLRRIRVRPVDLELPGRAGRGSSSPPRAGARWRASCQARFRRDSRPP